MLAAGVLLRCRCLCLALLPLAATMAFFARSLLRAPGLEDLFSSWHNLGSGKVKAAFAASRRRFRGKLALLTGPSNWLRNTKRLYRGRLGVLSPLSSNQDFFPLPCLLEAPRRHRTDEGSPCYKEFWCVGGCVCVGGGCVEETKHMEAVRRGLLPFSMPPWNCPCLFVHLLDASF